jgi:starch phosphorylase
MLGITRKQKRGASVLPAGQLVAYFCAEYGVGDNLPIYSGGLGVLAGDIFQEAAERNLPFVAVGLFYRKGYFHQYIDERGQNEYVQDINPAEVPLELLKDAKGETLLIEVPINERTVFAQVWKYVIGETPLYLLDTNHWKNNEIDQQITDQLYSGDQGKRIQQEIVLGIGGYRLLKTLEIVPTLYHMNEGHSAFLSLELINDELQQGHESHLPMEDAIARAKKRLVFTNHTLVAAGNDTFQHDQIRYFLGNYAFHSGIGIDTVLNLGNVSGQAGMFSMTILAMRASCRSNAVSRLHADKAVDLWPDFHLLSVTNGVHIPAWVAPDLQALWTENIPDWRKYVSDESVWKNIHRIPPKRLWDIHQELKARMLDEVYARTGIRLEQNTLTVVWARRFATYKRPDLLFSDIERLKKLLFSSDRPIQIIVSGKSHPADGQGKDIIKHIEHLANFDLKHRAVFVDDYSISLAKSLVAGADVWLNTPIYGLEASGTSGMKAAANGVVQFTTPDGWAHEVDWYGMGYTLPLDKAESEIYTLFEKKIIPTYYRHTTQGVPEFWVAMMKETIAAVTPAFSSQRMVNDYINTMYFPE